jgi:hypothetical protein
MAWDKLVKVFQIAAAALGIPAAAAGSYSAYKGYFSNEATCERLRGTILSTMEKHIPTAAKHTLLRKDVEEFDKLCGEHDPDARVIFDAALTETEPAATPTLAAHPSGNGAGAKTPATQAATAQQPPAEAARKALSVFGAPGSANQRGWVIIGRKDDSAWVINFSGYASSDTSLPPADTVLTAQRPLPVWSELFFGKADNAKLQSKLLAGACVRVVATRAAPARLWAEVVPASCS